MTNRQWTDNIYVIYQEAFHGRNHPLPHPSHLPLSPSELRPHDGADLLGFTLKELKREIEDGAIVAVWTALGERMTREELVAAAMLKWEQGAIEAALGKDAARVLPEAIRLVELRARVPRYQRDVLRELARREGRPSMRC